MRPEVLARTSLNSFLLPQPPGLFIHKVYFPRLSWIHFFQSNMSPVPIVQNRKLRLKEKLPTSWMWVIHAYSPSPWETKTGGGHEL